MAPEPAEPEKYSPLALIVVVLASLGLFSVFFLGFLVAPLAILTLFYVGFAASDRSKRGGRDPKPSAMAPETEPLPPAGMQPLGEPVPGERPPEQPAPRAETAG